VDLRQIVTEVGASSSCENLVNIVKQLAEFRDKNVSQECSDVLLALKQECDKGIQYRVQAGWLHDNISRFI
jgi:hypothetical protein